MDQFPLSWRFTDERWDARRGGLRADLHPLRPARARELAPPLADACAALPSRRGQARRPHRGAVRERGRRRAYPRRAGRPPDRRGRTDRRVVGAGRGPRNVLAHVHDGVAGLLLSRHGRRHDQPARRALGALLPPLGSLLVHDARRTSRPPDRARRCASLAAIATAARAGCRRLRARPPAGRPSRRRSAPCSRSASGCSGRRSSRRRGRNGGGGR